MIMTSQEQSIRRWWNIPRKPSERQEERHVTFLEMFYELVYVILIAEIAPAFSVHNDEFL